jgi:uncharacterized membrane protein YccC
VENRAQELVVSARAATLVHSVARHLRAHDPERASLKSAVRAAIFIPAVFAFADNVIGNPQTTIFSAFGSFSILVLTDFEGSPPRRLAAYLALAGSGFPLVALGTVCSRSTAAGACAMAVVGFAILFAGLINRYFAAAAFAALLAFILSANVPAPASAIPARFEGWALAAAVGIAAMMLVWPPRPRPGLRPAAARAFAALAQLLQAELDGAASLQDRIREADSAVAELRDRFVATPYRPTGTTSSAEALAFLVDELDWLRVIVVRRAAPGRDICPNENCETVAATIDVLRASAARLAGSDARPDLDRVLAARHASKKALARNVRALPASQDDATLASVLEPSFRAYQLSYAAWELGANALLATGAAPPGEDTDRRSIPRGPRGVVRLLAEQAQARAVWFQNSVRGAAGLTVAVYVAQRASLQHAFWVVLGTLSVLRSNALGTGATIVQAVAGTAIGIVIGGLLIVAIGADRALLWALLPLAILVAAFAPRAISFSAGQAGFTITLLVLFNIIQPSGWKVGLVRVEDVAIGFAISLGVGLLFWPRGARAALRETVAEAYATGADYLQAASVGGNSTSAQLAAGAATRRLDDTYRQFLAERGHERFDIGDVGALVTGATRVRLAAYSLMSMGDESGTWHPGPELEREATAVRGWYLSLAESIRRFQPAPRPEDTDGGGAAAALRQLADAVQAGHMTAIRAALGAALAAQTLADLREFELRLARALDDMTSADQAVTPGRDQAATTFVARA